MPEIRHELDDDQHEELKKLKDRYGYTWKGLLLAGANELEGDSNLETQRLDGLSYSEDRDKRVFPDPKDDRLGAFKAGWTNAEKGEIFGSSTLDSLTWHNLGWRLGRLFEGASGELKREIYMWCVDQQREADDTSK